MYYPDRRAEGGDRRYEKGDYLLSDVEEESLRLLSAHYKKLVLVLNCGSVIDLSILDQVRMMPLFSMRKVVWKVEMPLRIF